ncbi:MAG: nuclear transport factor 2 family protein [Chitinophagaceae bacterium]|nr:MAG: nuclear transport factor 2 family protein [Chitinophagaceae bacterium]
MKERAAIVQYYIEGYNEMNLEKMTAYMDPSIEFKNVSNGVVDMQLEGLAAFAEQAEQAMKLFASRKQEIIATRHVDGAVEVDINYHAVLAADLPDGLKKGQELSLDGTSIFTFDKHNKIRSITDIS